MSEFACPVEVEIAEFKPGQTTTAISRCSKCHLNATIIISTNNQTRRELVRHYTALERSICPLRRKNQS